MRNENTPILVANEEWPLPEILIKDVQVERMVNGLIDLAKPNVLSPEDSVGWAECVAYLMPETQRRPVRNDVSEIYLYCVGKLMERKGVKVDIELPKELSDFQMGKLREFKLWIYKNRGGKEKNPVINALKEVFFEANK